MCLFEFILWRERDVYETFKGGGHAIKVWEPLV
jgi:hypothetical protein